MLVQKMIALSEQGQVKHQENHLNPIVRVNRDTWRDVSTTDHPSLRSNTAHGGLWLRDNEINVILSF